jgi:hypothetical protein
MAKKNKQAIHYDLTTSTIKRYTNPFEISRHCNDFDLRSLMQTYMKPKEPKKEK